MKKILILIIVFLASALYFHDELKQIISPPEGTLKFEDLVYRDGLTYKRSSGVLFTGEVSGSEKGSFKNGKREGAWVSYHDDGQLESKGNYKNGMREGAWVGYWGNGQLKYSGNNTNGKNEGAWVYYYNNGRLSSKGKYKNGEFEGEWIFYHENGQLNYKRSYKNGKEISD